MNKLREKILALWYQKPGIITYLLLPLTVLFMFIIWLRRLAYQCGLKKSVKFPVPVIVVGNITVGGTGKTPLVIYLATLLQQHGYKPGIISRGYGGDNATVRTVTALSSAKFVGDEPLLIHKRTGCPVVVSRDRALAAKTLLAENDCDIILSDDGLQHYALQRDIEIVVVDGIRRFGNRFCLPSGPLRESVASLQGVDFIVCNGHGAPGEFSMQLQAECLQNIEDKNCKKPLAEFIGKTVHAVAAIGNPERFFNSLVSQGIEIHKCAFPDHYMFRYSDLSFADALPVVMTEKDAVKCLSFGNERLWYVPVSATIAQNFARQVLEKLSHIPTK